MEAKRLIILVLISFSFLHLSSVFVMGESLYVDKQLRAEQGQINPSSETGLQVHIDTSLVEDERVNVGSTQSVRFHASWINDDSDVKDGILYVNGTGYVLNSSGWIEFNIRWPLVGRLTWVITGVNCSGVTDYVQTASNPTIIWDYVQITSYSVSDNRVDVGSTQHIYVTAQYGYDGQPFTSGTLYVNGFPAIYDDVLDKWVLAFSSHTVAKHTFKVSSVRDDLYNLTALLDPLVPPSIIWDRVIVTLSVLDDRINVNDNASIHAWAIYDYDDTAFMGTISLNDSLTKSLIGGYGYITASISDTQYGLTSFTSNDVYVIFDRVDITITITDRRIDVGSAAPLSWSGSYQYDGATFSGSVSYNDSSSKNAVGKYGFKVDSISDPTHGISAFSTNEVYVIFDRIKITDMWVSDERADVGSIQHVYVAAVYEYDDTAFSNGTLYLNDEAMQWDFIHERWFKAYSSNDVKKMDFKVTEVNDGLHGLSTLHPFSKPSSIVWDRVMITLSIPDDRINLGSTPQIEVEARYEYDKTPLVGIITLNDTMVKNAVGKYWFKAERIEDDLYELTAFTSNTVYVIYDRVSIELHSLYSRINVDSKATIRWKAHHEYGGEPFKGTIILNDSLIKNEVGKFYYTVSSVSGDEYGITVFKSNRAYVIFDRVNITLSVFDQRIDVGSNADISFTGIYEYDSENFAGTITLNDTVSKNDVGKYYYTVSSITDPLYGLTASTSNSVYVVFDKIVITLSVQDPSITVGETPHIDIRAVYAYDKSTYDGVITLNDTFTKDDGGRYGYTVSSISGDKHGITLFEANAVSVTFRSGETTPTLEEPKPTPTTAMTPGPTPKSTPTLSQTPGPTSNLTPTPTASPTPTPKPAIADYALIIVVVIALALIAAIGLLIHRRRRVGYSTYR